MFGGVKQLLFIAICSRVGKVVILSFVLCSHVQVSRHNKNLANYSWFNWWIFFVIDCHKTLHFKISFFNLRELRYENKRTDVKTSYLLFLYIIILAYGQIVLLLIGTMTKDISVQAKILVSDILMLWASPWWMLSFSFQTYMVIESCEVYL